MVLALARPNDTDVPSMLWEQHQWSIAVVGLGRNGRRRRPIGGLLVFDGLVVLV
jgi:hypothetical protein